MAKVIIKNGEISSSAGINIPGSLTISGNVTIGDNFTDTLTVKSAATFNDDLTVLDTISGSNGLFASLTGSIISGTIARFTSITGTLNGNIIGNANTVTNGIYTTNIASNATTGVTAGNGLTGGGTTGVLTLNVGAGTGISVASDSISINNSVVATLGDDQTFTSAKIFNPPSATSTSSYVAEFRNSSSTNNASRFIWSQGSTYALATNIQATATTAGTTEFQWINRSTGAVISTPLKFDNVSSGDVVLPDGNLVIGTSGKGISFVNTTPDSTIGANGSLDSELLDDYEEGTFTPTLSATSATFAYTANYGRYIKIGNMVTVYGYVALSSRTSIANNVSINGLPFSVYSTGAFDFLGCSVSLRFTALTTAVVGIWGLITGANTLLLYKRTAAAVNDSSFLASDLANTTSLYFSATYRTT